MPVVSGTAMRLAQRPSASANQSWIRTCPSVSPPPGDPLQDLRSQPEPRPTPTEIHHRSRHVGVSLLIGGDRVSVAQAEEIRDTLRIDQVVGVDLRGHVASLHPLTYAAADV